MSPRFVLLPGALRGAAARVLGSRFAKPIARVVLVAAGLVLLAIIGRASASGALGGSAAAAIVPVDAGSEPAAVATTPASPAAPAPTATSPSDIAPSPTRGRASPDDPVVLNSAGPDDLRRLPGIGSKRADAIIALRTRLGRFHAIEDLMKVKGIGRAMLRRLRPLVRLDPPPQALADGGR